MVQEKSLKKREIAENGKRSMGKKMIRYPPLLWLTADQRWKAAEEAADESKEPAAAPSSLHSARKPQP